jgi:hypothetical protein
MADQGLEVLDTYYGRVSFPVLPLLGLEKKENGSKLKKGQGH